MHADEVETDPSLVRRLLAGQFPEWADQPIDRVDSSGTDHAIYRLGRDLAVRLPRIAWAVGQFDTDERWLPRLAPHLPLAIPVPLARGEPAEGYPWPWGVYRWLEGENVPLDHLADPERAAIDLAEFVTSLQRISTRHGPPAATETSGRGGPLTARDRPTRAAIDALHGVVDTQAVAREWDTALAAPGWSGPPVWIHGDLLAGNLLARDGRISAVIDFGCLGIGDPASDLIVVWNYLSPETRRVFRSTLEVDDATWARGRGLALSIALIQLPYYLHTNPVLVRSAHRTIAELLADQG